MTPVTINKKPAAVAIRDGLYLVLTTTPLTSRKDSDNDLVHDRCARV